MSRIWLGCGVVVCWWNGVEKEPGSCKMEEMENPMIGFPKLVTEAELGRVSVNAENEMSISKSLARKSGILPSEQN